jgi:serine phosphatase RsbU (regulator of sigma subunit)
MAKFLGRLSSSLNRLLQGRYPLHCAWDQVRWKIVAIIVSTGTSAVLIGLLAVAALNVVVRRESANVIEKQIQVLVQASRSVAPAILEHASYCEAPPTNSGVLKPLLAYTDQAFPQAQAFLAVEGSRGVQSSLSGLEAAVVKRPVWLPESGFGGLVADRGHLEIRHVLAQQKGGCKATVTFSLPLGSELAKRLSWAAGMEVTTVSPSPYRVHPPNQHVLRTIEGNFMPGLSRPAAVVLTVRNWQTGELEDWIAYSVQSRYLSSFEDVARLGRQMANWVWLLAAFSITVLLLDASGVWMCIRLGSDIATAVDDLSSAARQIANGNFAWRTPVRNKGQLGALVGSFNEMAIALERLQKEEAVKLRLESELQVAQIVQEHLFPHVTPVLRGATIAGQTSEARAIGGDLYDFFDLGQERIGILCADVSGKGIPAALMMANLQAIARAHLVDRLAGPSAPPAQFVQTLNQQLAGRFGDNRYATLFWAEYNAQRAVLTYVNAGQPAPILIRSTGEIERLDSDGFPIGMFANARYTAREVRMGPGSRLVIFSDGLTDAQNVAGEEFGERLIEYCKSIRAGIDAKEVVEHMMRAAVEWSIGTEQFDDTTVVVVDVASESYPRH